MKHSGARHLGVTIGPRDGRARLLVEDDGRGFDPERAGGDGHFGLRMLEDLVREAGGELEIESAPGKGSRVKVELAS